MSRTGRALAMLVLSLTLFGATTAVVAAAPSTPSAVEDQNDRLLRGIEAAAAAQTQAAFQAARSMERNLGSRDAAPGVAVEDQNDRLLHGIEAAAAARTQAAFELARSMERNLTPVAVDGGTTQIVPRADAVVPPAEGNGFAALLFGLVGGVIGGVAVMSGWAAVARRRLHRAVPAS